MTAARTSPKFQSLRCQMVPSAYSTRLMRTRSRKGLSALPARLSALMARRARGAPRQQFLVLAGLDLDAAEELPAREVRRVGRLLELVLPEEHLDDLRGGVADFDLVGEALDLARLRRARLALGLLDRGAAGVERVHARVARAGRVVDPAVALEVPVGRDQGGGRRRRPRVGQLDHCRLFVHLWPTTSNPGPSPAP